MEEKKPEDETSVIDNPRVEHELKIEKRIEQIRLDPNFIARIKRARKK